MIRELKNAFAPRGWLLSAAVGAGKYTIDAAYDIPAMNRYVIAGDYIISCGIE